MSDFAKDTNVPTNDCISRQAAIDALDKRFDDVPMELTTEILQLRHDLRERIPSAQPATNCSEIPNSSDDTISRQAAIDEIKEIYEWHDNVTKERIIEHFKQLPSEQPERKKGKWIDITKCGGASLWKCSECGELFLEDFYYCPNCGAKMQER